MKKKKRLTAPKGSGHLIIWSDTRLLRIKTVTTFESVALCWCDGKAVDFKVWEIECFFHLILSFKLADLLIFLAILSFLWSCLFWMFFLRLVVMNYPLSCQVCYIFPCSLACFVTKLLTFRFSSLSLVFMGVRLDCVLFWSDFRLTPVCASF